MSTIHQIAIAAALSATSALSAPARSVGAKAFVEDSDAALEEWRLADLLPGGRLAIRWRLRGTPGASLRQYQRVDWQPRPGLALHALAERDPGEVRWTDFTTWYADWRGHLGALTVGDLRPGFGQGLVFGRAGSRGGSSPGPRSDRAQAGYRSTAESAAVAGVLLRPRAGELEAALLAARLTWDARLSGEGRATSIVEDGWHATPSQRATRDRLAGTVVGAALRWHRGRHAAGIQALALDLTRSLDLRRHGKAAAAFRGRGQHLASADLRWEGARAGLYAETALDSAGRAAILAGLNLGRTGCRAKALLFHYPPAWFSPLGGAVSNSAMTNEQGVQVELAGKGWRLYAVQHRRLQSAYSHPLPAPVFSWGARGVHSLSQRWELAAALQLRSGEEYSGGVATGVTSRRLRADLVRQAGGQRWRLRGEGRAVRAAGAEEAGALASIAWRWRGRRWALDLHGSGFHTGSYHTRLYEYETELPGAVSILPLYGTGCRAYAVGRLTWKGWSAGLRWRQDWFKGRASRREAAMQVDVATR